MKRFNIKGLIIWVVILAVLHFGTGFIVSPAAGSFIIGKINEYAGTKINIDRVSVWPLTLSFSLKGVKVFDPDNPSERIAKADSVLVNVSPWALLARRLVFSSVSSSGVEINIEGTPDGGFNIQKLAASKKSASAGLNTGAILNTLGQKQDWFSRVYGLTKNKFSKPAAEKKKTAQKQAKAIAKEVVRLPKGKRVNFKTGKDLYLFEIRSFSINDAYINLKAQNGQAVAIEKARVRLGRLAFDPDNGAKLDVFNINGQVSSNGSPAGSLEILFSKTISVDTQKAQIKVNLKEVDLNAVRFIYEDSLPVNVVKGKLTLVSDTVLTGEEIDSKNTLTLTDQVLEPKNNYNLTVGFIPLPALVDAMNSIQPLELKFTITGTMDKPEFGGFQESLMTLAKPILGNIEKQLKKKGIKIIGKFLTNGKSETIDSSQGGADASGTDKQDAAQIISTLNSLLGNKKK